MSGFIKDVLEEIVKEGLLKFLSDKSNQGEHNKFISTLTEWAENYIKANEGRVISGGNFANIIKNYNIIDNVIEYIKNPSEKSESEFIEEKVNIILNNISEKENITLLDKSCIKEFVRKILSEVKNYYEKHITDELVPVNYGLCQLHHKIDKISESAFVADKIGSVEKKPIIIKKKYDVALDNLIERKVAPFSDVQQGAFHLFFYRETHERLFKICCDKKQVVLLGDAGCGKSIALQQLAEEVYFTKYYPLIYDLRNYTSQEISEIVDDCYYGINSESLFLIFDAYDEIEEKNKYDFARKLTQFACKNPKTIIVISTRGNFYSFADDNGEGGTFKGFHEYGLCPLTSKDIKAFVEKNAIRYEMFVHELQRQGLNNMVSSPFYLRELVELIKKHGELPEKNEIMEEMIRIRFKSDVKKYVITKGIQNYEYEIMLNLQKVAFAMQCMHQIELNDLDYQKLFPSELREILMFSGVFNKNASFKWEFEHNNFREYLAAKYLSELEFELFKKVICNSDDSIKASWANVLSYYLLLNPGEKVIEWLSQSDMSILVKCERSRIVENDRNEIFIKIFASYTERNIWITRSSINLQELVNFGQSPTTCDYLCNRIENSKHFREQSNAITVLSKFSNLYGKNLLVEKVLFSCVKSNTSREYEKLDALETLVCFNIQSKEITDYLLKIYDINLPSCFRYGIILYLSKTKNFHDYIDIFLKEYALGNASRETYSSSITWCINDVLERVCEYTAVHKTICYFSYNSETYYKEHEVFKSIIISATKLYKEGKTELFDVFYETMIRAADNCNQPLFNFCKEFFVRNKLLKTSFVKIIEKYKSNWEPYIVRMLSDLADDECYQTLLDMYFFDCKKYSSLFRDITLFMKPENDYYIKYVKALKETEGIELPERIYINYEIERQKGNKIYFDSLFDKAKFIELVDEMLDYLGDSKMTVEQFRKISIHTEHSSESMGIVCCSLSSWLIHTKNKDMQVKELANRIVQREDFGMSEIYNFIKTERYVSVDESQKKIIYQYCLNNIDKGDLRNEIKEKDNGISCSWNLVYIIFFSSYFDFCYDEDIYFKMLSVPSFLFYKENEQKINDDFPSYLKKHLSKNQIEMWILNNAKYEHICRDVSEICIKYCENNNLDFVLELAERYCETERVSEYTKQIAIQYIDKIKGCNYIYNKFLNTHDDVLFKCIVNITKKYHNIALIEKLEKCNEIADDRTKFLNELISMQSKKGLQIYYEISKKKMEIVDYLSKDNLLHITEAISCVKVPELMPELQKLQQLLFLPKFKDVDSFGLRNSLSKAFFNISKNNYKEVKSHIDETLQKPDLSEEEKCFCYSLLEEIKIQLNSEMDCAWSLTEIKNFFARTV